MNNDLQLFATLRSIAFLESLWERLPVGLEKGDCAVAIDALRTWAATCS